MPKERTTKVRFADEDEVNILQPVDPELKVRFADEDEVNILQPVDPELKSTLYYSKEELYFIQKRFQVALILRRQAQRLNEFKQALKENQIYMNHLRAEKTTTKRSFQETLEVSRKRRRLNPLALTVV